jgi:Ni/Co efflux regulator RcnB
VKTKAIVCAITALSLGLSGVAFAQGHGPDRQRGPAVHNGAHHSDMRHGDARHPGPRHGPRGPVHMDNRGHAERGAGPDHNFYRGARLPAYYRSHQYVVDDWRGHHLHQPPRGYHWVQTGADYVLVAIATGVIAQLLLGSN